MAKWPTSQLKKVQDTKRVPPPDSFLTILGWAGKEKYSDLLIQNLERIPCYHW